MSKYTLGRQWKVGGAYSTMVYTKAGEQVATCHIYPGRVLEAMDNAKLLSSAPALLRACKDAMKKLMDMAEPAGNQDKGRRLAAICSLAQVIND